MKEKIKKQKHERRGYLLGIEKDGSKVYLELPTWDCGWYWGFGYIEKYYPHAKEQHTHTHWDNDLTGKQENEEYAHHLNDNKEFISTVLTDTESWTLSELMSTFYTLREAADLFGHGGSHITNNPLKEQIKNPDTVTLINKTLLPLLFKEVDKILSHIRQKEK